MSLLYLYKYSAFEVFLIFLGIFLLIDGLIAFILKKRLPKRNYWIYKLHLIVAGVVYISLLWAFFIHSWERNLESFSTFFFLTNHLSILYLSKIFFLLIALFALFFNKKIIIKTAFISGLFVFIILLWGLYWGRFNFIIKENVIYTQHTTNTSLKIVFISDLHIGQYYGNEREFEQLIRQINNQHPDLIVLGGDMICFFAEEMKHFVPYLKQLSAKYGVYAIHGNHDYGDYFWWKNKKEKLWNHRMLEYYYELANIRLLNNEQVTLPEASIVLVGIENCGHIPYGCHADWEKALRGITNDHYIILLAHDPWNWQKVLAQYPQIKLTLSGHTHAYQFGIDNGRTRWSPFNPKNPWCGLYSRKDQYLYISHGVGSAMFSARVGMWPEITVLTLRNE